MTAGEFHETMLRLLRREPFQPFDIELADGRVLRIDIPEMICTSGGAATRVHPSGEGDIIFFDHSETVRLGNATRSPA